MKLVRTGQQIALGTEGLSPEALMLEELGFDADDLEVTGSRFSLLSPSRGLHIFGDDDEVSIEQFLSAPDSGEFARAARSVLQVLPSVSQVSRDCAVILEDADSVGFAFFPSVLRGAAFEGAVFGDERTVEPRAVTYLERRVDRPGRFFEFSTAHRSIPDGALVHGLRVTLSERALVTRKADARKLITMKAVDAFADDCSTVARRAAEWYSKR